jgi:hypothetical protein
VGRLLRKLNFRRISVRPQHPESDQAAQDIFKKALPSWPWQPFLSRRATSRSKFGGRCYEGGHRLF